MTDAALSVQDLSVRFHLKRGILTAVNDVSFDIGKRETFGLVGESGSGKSVTARAIMKLVPSPPGEVAGDGVVFDGEKIYDLDDEQIRDLRGRKMAMVFQEPMSALNPVYTVGEQIGDVVRTNLGMNKKEGKERAIELLELVGIPSARSRVDNYVHEFSGGMRQRVMLAMAMSCDPAFLIADEPTTALDVTVQAQILELIGELQRTSGMSVLLITHDLGVVAEVADHVAVMYAGKVVEYATVEALFERPSHPYTIGLFRSLPDLAGPGERLHTIPGTVPNAFHFPSGCRYRTRCPLARERCAEAEPELVTVEGSEGAHTAACHFPEEARAL